MKDEEPVVLPRLPPSLGHDRGKRWVRSVRYAEISTDRTEEFWSDVNAVKRAKDEILVAVVDHCRLEASRDLSLEEYLRRRKDKEVLICGDYNMGLARLDEIERIVRDAGYEPIRLDAIAEFPQYDLRQKFDAIAPHVRFIVIDDSSPAGQMVEVALAERGRWITLVLRVRGSTSSFMTRGASATSTVLREMDYSENDLADVLQDGLMWGEERIKALGEEHVSTFPWRPPPDLGPTPLP